VSMLCGLILEASDKPEFKYRWSLTWPRMFAFSGYGRSKADCDRKARAMVDMFVANHNSGLPLVTASRPDTM
jgi:hypothetical protein